MALKMIWNDNEKANIPEICQREVSTRTRGKLFKLELKVMLSIKLCVRKKKFLWKLTFLEPLRVSGIIHFAWLVWLAENFGSILQGNAFHRIWQFIAKQKVIRLIFRALNSVYVVFLTKFVSLKLRTVHMRIEAFPKLIKEKLSLSNRNERKFLHRQAKDCLVCDSGGFRSVHKTKSSKKLVVATKLNCWYFFTSTRARIF